MNDKYLILNAELIHNSSLIIQNSSSGVNLEALGYGE